MNYRRDNEDYFLLSREWRTVRMAALERDGASCACCGATAADGVKMNVDHIKPRSRFPELALTVSNLQILCDACNHGKGNRYETNWRKQEKVQNTGQSRRDVPRENAEMTGALAELEMLGLESCGLELFYDSKHDICSAKFNVEPSFPLENLVFEVLKKHISALNWKDGCFYPKDVPEPSKFAEALKLFDESMRDDPATAMERQMRDLRAVVYAERGAA